MTRSSMTGSSWSLRRKSAAPNWAASTSTWGTFWPVRIMMGVWMRRAMASWRFAEAGAGAEAVIEQALLRGFPSGQRGRPEQRGPTQLGGERFARHLGEHAAEQDERAFLVIHQEHTGRALNLLHGYVFPEGPAVKAVLARGIGAEIFYLLPSGGGLFYTPLLKRRRHSSTAADRTKSGRACFFTDAATRLLFALTALMLAPVLGFAISPALALDIAIPAVRENLERVAERLRPVGYTLTERRGHRPALAAPRPAQRGGPAPDHGRGDRPSPRPSRSRSSVSSPISIGSPGPRSSRSTRCRGTGPVGQHFGARPHGPPGAARQGPRRPRHRRPLRLLGHHQGRARVRLPQASRRCGR